MGVRATILAAAASAALALMPATQARAADAGNFTVTLTGQTMIRSDFRETTPAFSAAIAPFLKGNAVFTNFESTVALEGQPNKANTIHGKGVIAPAAALDALTGIGFNLFSFANNHAWDMDDAGILNAVAEADARHIAHAGTGATLRDAAAPAYLLTARGTIALIAQASGLIVDGAAATETRPGVNEVRVPGAGTADAKAPLGEDAERVLDNIRAAAKIAGLVVVYHHNHVYEKPFTPMFREHMPERFVPPAWIKAWAHREIDAGADLIVMHGAPVVQGVEIYNGKPIFYDLGNFMFNLDHSDDIVFAEDDIWESVIASATFENRRVRTIRFVPIVLNKAGHGGEPLFIQTRGMPAPAHGAKARAILANLAKLSVPFGTKLNLHGDTAMIDVK